MKSNRRILLIEVCNFTDYPIGGYLSFAKQMLTAFGNQLALVGLASEDMPVGKWVKKEINGIVYDYFGVAKFHKTNKKTIIPYRLKSYLAVRKYKHEILKIGIDNVFIQTPEVLFALNNCKINNLCNRIPGVENPLSISRYWYGSFFAKIFDLNFFSGLLKSNLILASADKIAIQDFVKRGRNIIPIEKVIQFPTRVNTDIFRPLDKVEERASLNLPSNEVLIVTTGRLSELKGWKFMLDCFIEFKSHCRNSTFIFLGDGEDRDKIEQYSVLNGIKSSVIITGRISHDVITKYINAADLFIMGSYIEGWATSLVEAIACAKPIVCTNFSSAKELVIDNINGYVVENRDVNKFVSAMNDCLNSINRENLINRSNEMQKYAVSSLKNSIEDIWTLL